MASLDRRGFLKTAAVGFASHSLARGAVSANEEDPSAFAPSFPSPGTKPTSTAPTSDPYRRSLDRLQSSTPTRECSSLLRAGGVGSKRVRDNGLPTSSV